MNMWENYHFDFSFSQLKKTERTPMGKQYIRKAYETEI